MVRPCILVGNVEICWLAERPVLGKNGTRVLEYGSRPQFFSGPPIRPRPANDVQIFVLNFKSGVRVRLTFRAQKKATLIQGSRFCIFTKYVNYL